MNGAKRKMRNTLRFVLVLAAILSLGLLLASCGDDPATTTTAAATTTTASGATTTAPVTTAAVTYKVTFKAGTLSNGKVGAPYNTVAEVTFNEGDTSVVEPTCPPIYGFIAEWDSYTLGSKSIVVNAVYTSLETGTDGLSFALVTPAEGDPYVEVVGYNGRAERKTVVVPATYSMKNASNQVVSYPVKSIADQAFFGHPMQEIRFMGEIVSMGDQAFSGCANLTSITLPSVERIGDYAFFGCESLASIVIPNSVKEIGHAAFADCYALESAVIGTGVEKIGESAFSGCHSLASATIPASVRTIGNRAFLGCGKLATLTVLGSPTLGSNAFVGCVRIQEASVPAGWLHELSKANLLSLTVTSGISLPEGALADAPLLETLSLPASLNNIGSLAFYGCYSLRTVTVAAENTAFCVDGGFLYNKDLTKLYLVPAMTEGVVTVKDSVTEIADGAFAYCSLMTEIEIPAGLQTVGKSAFEGCTALLEVTLPNGTLSVGDGAFAGCTLLNKVDLPQTLTSVGDGILSGCMAVTEASVPANVALALEKENLRKLTVTAGSFIGVKAFYNCANLSEIVLADSLTTIGANAFTGTAYYNDPDNWTTVGEGKLLYIGNHLITAVNISGECTVRAGVVSLAASAFANNTAMTSIVLPETVASIGKDAFKNCVAINAATVPTSALASMPLTELTSISIVSGAIPENAFAGCTALASITLGSGVTAIGKNAFNDTAYYKNASMWTDGGKTLYINDCLIVAKSEISGAYTVRENTALIANGAFAGNAALTAINFPASLKYVGNGAFLDCSEITAIALPAGLVSVGNNAFQGCLEAVSVNIPENVVIGKEAFRGCAAIETLLVPASVVSIGENAFADCTALRTISIPAAVVSSIHKEFLENVTITSGTALEKDAFKNSLSLASITLPETLESIGDGAFAGCALLTNIELPASLTEMGKGVFFGCSALQSVTLAAGNTEFAAEDGVLYNAGKTTLLVVPAQKTAFTIPASVARIDDYAFANGRLTGIVVPDTVTAIGPNAFNGCAALESLTLPASIGRLDNSIFVGCTSLKSVAAPTLVLNSNFVSIVKDSLEELYINGGNGTTNFTTSFASCTSLVKLTVDPSVNNGFHANAFGSCSSLREANVTVKASLNLPATLVKLTINSGTIDATAVSALNRKTALTSVVIGEDVTVTGSGLCNSLSSLSAIFSEGAKPADWDTNKWTDKPVYFAGEWSYVSGVPTPNVAP